MSQTIIKANVVDISKRSIAPCRITIEDHKIKSIVEIDETLDCYAIPGFIDAHIHIESSMLAPSEFAKAAVRHGTIATVSDPHEIANVLGMSGIEFMINNAAQSPMKFYFGAPSCVPATDFETSGAKITVENIKELLSRDEIKYLSEMMNYPGVIYDSPEVFQKLKAAKDANKPIDGHIPGISGEMLKKYAQQGITTDHECFTLAEAEEKIKLGMKILIREGSAAKNFDALHPLFNNYAEHIMLCSDDKHPNDIVQGHINELVKRAVALGYDLFEVLKAASLNAIKHYNLESACLQVSDSADFILVNNLIDFEIISTYIDGNCVFDSAGVHIDSPAIEPINNFNLNQKLPIDFQVKALGNQIRIIEVIEGQLITNEIIMDAKIHNGLAVADLDRDILKIAVIDRYNNGIPQIGFIKNFGLKSGAIATSVAHDSHNIISIACDDESLSKAVNCIIKNKGGMAVVDANNIYELPLPIAGILSTNAAEPTSEKYLELESKAKALGSTLHSPFMTLSFMALLVIPKLKIGDKGLFDGEKFEFTDLFKL